jgi:hypothetical protein
VVQKSSRKRNKHTIAKKSYLSRKMMLVQKPSQKRNQESYLSKNQQKDNPRVRQKMTPLISTLEAA